MKTFSKILLFACLIVNISGCVGDNMESFVRPDTDLSFVKRVAVMPIQNNSKDAFVAERVRDMVITQLLASGMFDVVDKGLVDSALRDQAVNLSKGPMDAGVMKRLGQLLHVQAFMLGTIDNAERVQRGAVSFPQMVITLRLVDTNNGVIFWQASGHNSGDSLAKRLFGLSSDDSFNVSFKLLRRLLATIPEGRPVPVKKVAAAEPSVKTSPSSSVKPGNGADTAKEVGNSANGADSTGQVVEDSGSGGARDIFDNNSASTSDSNSDAGGIIISPDSASQSDSNSDAGGIIISPDSASQSDSNSDAGGIIIGGGADAGQGADLPTASDADAAKADTVPADQSGGDKKLDFDDDSLDAAHLPPK